MAELYLMHAVAVWSEGSFWIFVRPDLDVKSFSVAVNRDLDLGRGSCGERGGSSFACTG